MLPTHHSECSGFAGKKVSGSLFGVSMTHQIEYMQELSLHGMRHVQDPHIESLMDKTSGSGELQLVLPPCAQRRVPDLRLPWLHGPDSILAGGQLASPSADAAKWTVGPCEGECVCFNSVHVGLHDVHRPSRSHKYWAVAHLLRICKSLLVRLLAQASFVFGSLTSASNTSKVSEPVCQT